MRLVYTRATLALALILVFTSFSGGCSRTATQPLPETTPAAPESEASAAFPLRVLPTQRYLTDQTGHPFLVHGDTAWSLLVQLTREEANHYLEDRRQRGFNTLLINLLEHEFAKDAPRNAYGDAPFAEPGDYSRPNEWYFAHVDWVLRRAADLGFLVLLAPSYLGYEGGSQGWYQEMRDAGIESLKAYGRYLGMRYRALPNIIWIHGGDYNPPERTFMQAIIKGLREANPESLHSFHGARGTSARGFVGEKAAWLFLNDIYTDENGVVAAAHNEYTASSLPFLLIEGRYEGEGASAAVVRAQAYQAILSGACGQLIGNKLMWSFDRGWEGELDSPGARSMMRMRSLLEALRWWRLRPRFGDFIVDGVGSGALQAVSAVSVDKQRAVIYVPSSRELILDASALSGPRLGARWIDPANAHSVRVQGSLNKSVRLKLRPPARNSSGDEDWLLVLESVQ